MRLCDLRLQHLVAGVAVHEPLRRVLDEAPELLVIVQFVDPGSDGSRVVAVLLEADRQEGPQLGWSVLRAVILGPHPSKH